MALLPYAFPNTMGLRISFITLLSLYFKYLDLPECSCQNGCYTKRLTDVGFVEIKPLGKCLYFSSSKYDWRTAWRTCSNIGARLYTAHHARDLLYEYQIPYDDRHEDFWIGLNDINKEGDFKWSLELPPSISADTKHRALSKRQAKFFPWRQGQPDDDDGGQDCVVKGRDGLWVDEVCDRTFRFICEAKSGIGNFKQEDDSLNLKEESRTWLTTIIVLALCMAVIPAAVHLVTKARMDKRAAKSSSDGEGEDTMINVFRVDSVYSTSTELSESTFASDSTSSRSKESHSDTTKDHTSGSSLSKTLEQSGSSGSKTVDSSGSSDTKTLGQPGSSGSKTMEPFGSKTGKVSGSMVYNTLG